MAQLREVISFFASVLPIRTTIEDEIMEIFRYDLATNLSSNVTLEDIVSQTKTSSQDRSYFKHPFAPGGLNMRIANRFDASDIITTTGIISLPNSEEKYEYLLTVHYRTGEVILHFNNYLYTEETARQFLDAYCGLVDTLG
ncbi:hypothetical protein BDM02DRAFT_3124977, partial [Thelephora ganbajun]